MNLLRWILGLMMGGVLAGFIVLTVVGGSFRKSFGASETSPFVIMLPLLVMAILFWGIVFPTYRSLLHVGAITAATLLVICGVNMSGISILGIAYFGLWLFYYWLAAWSVQTKGAL